MRVLLIEEVADLLRCTPQEVQVEIESGKLEAFRVAGQPRVLESELQRFASGTPAMPDHGSAGSRERENVAQPCPADAGPTTRLLIESEPMSPFAYVWPDGEANKYPDPMSVTVESDGKKAYFIVGKAKSPKKQLGQLRWRYNVFLATK